MLFAALFLMYMFMISAGAGMGDNSLNMGENGFGVMVIVLMFLFASVSLTINLIFSYQRRRIDPIIICFILYLGYIFFMCVPYINYPIKEIARAAVFPSTSIILMILFYFILRNSPKLDVYINNVFLVLFIAYSVFFMYLYRFYFSQSASFTLADAYYILLFLPWLLIYRVKVLRLLLVFFIAFISILSRKRGVFICLILAIPTFYFVQNFFVSQKHKILSIISTPIVLLLIAFVILHSGESFDELVQRFNSLDTDEGSGRLEIWQTIMDSFSESNIMSKFFGNGYYGTLTVLGRVVCAAHNDFIQTLYNYGIICLILQIVILALLIRKALYLIKQKSRYASAFSATIVIYISMMMFSTIYNAPGYSVLIFTSLGYMLSLSEHETNHIPHHLKDPVLYNRYYS